MVGTILSVPSFGHERERGGRVDHLELVRRMLSIKVVFWARLCCTTMSFNCYHI